MKRNHSVTIAKALAIILMVLGHAGAPSWLNHYLALMRMPLFFFMSGYCFKESYLYGGGKSWLQKRIKGIYWPYVKWGVVFVLLHNVLLDAHIYSTIFEFNGKTIHYYSFQEMLTKLLYVCTMHSSERLLGGFWFLKALFGGSLIFYIVRKTLNNTIVAALMLLVFTLVTSYFNWRIPYFHIGSLDLFAAFFIMIGHSFKTTKIGNHSFSEHIITRWWLIFGFAIIVGVGSVYWPTSMLHYQWHQVLPYATTAIMGTFIIFAIGHWINKWKNGSRFVILNKAKNGIKTFLIYTGGYTFNILTWHFLSFKVVSILIIWRYGLSIEQLGDFPGISEYAHKGWWICYLLVGVGLPICGTWVYHRIVDKK